MPLDDRVIFKLEGLGSVAKDFKAMTAEMQNVIAKRALNTAGRYLIQRVRAKIPKRTGRLKRSIKQGIDTKKRYGLQGFVYADPKIAPHAHLVEYGHDIVPRGKKGQSNRGGAPTGQRVPAHPFMANAFDENARNVTNIINQIIQIGVRKHRNLGNGTGK